MKILIELIKEKGVINLKKKNSILVVDDNSSNLMELSYILQDEYNILTAMNGASALEKADAFLPDLILLDIIMADISGFEVLNELKSSDKVKSIPVIFITGLSGESKERVGLSIGAVDYIRKPFDEAIVKLRVKQQIEIINLRRDLENAARAAEEASKSKSFFLANMSHEIRTPMNSIIGFSELALDDDIPQKTKDYLTNILRNSKWLLNIINDILDISKIESGKLELESIPFDLQEIFSTCQTMIQPKADEKGLTLFFYSEPFVGKMPLGDPTRLRQVLINLLSNAIKFTKSGSIKILAEIKNTDKKSVSIYFEVKDSGIGLTPEQIELVLHPYAQAETSTTRKYGGTGLGLAITNFLVEMMGGQLKVESIPEVGSKFSFELTFDTIDVNEDALPAVKIMSGELEKPVFEGEVLVFEDNAMNQKVICEHLSRVGLKTVIANNGKIGVDLVQSRMIKSEKQFDLIFMDIHMPVMDGLEATKKILELNSGVSIVAMTANIMSHDRELYNAGGMSDYIGKPFTSQELWRCLMKYLKPVTWRKENTDSAVDIDNKLHQRLINIFMKSNSRKFDEISDAISAGDIKLAHRLVHSLKSNAGQLNKTALQQIAGEVEKNLIDGENLVTPQQLEMLEREFNAVIAEFTALV